MVIKRCSHSVVSLDISNRSSIFNNPCFFQPFRRDYGGCARFILRTNPITDFVESTDQTITALFFPNKHFLKYAYKLCLFNTKLCRINCESTPENFIHRRTLILFSQPSVVWKRCEFRCSHRKCSIKKLFLKVSQYLQQSTCVGVCQLY